MCLQWMYTRVRCRLIECHARAHYRLNRWQASRVRKQWLKRENKYRKELECIFRSSSGYYDDEGIPTVRSDINQPVISQLYTYKEKRNVVWTNPLSYKHLTIENCSQNDCREIPLNNIQKKDTTIQYEEGVSVLSPQRLSERLSENALAREAVGESDMELAQYLQDERIALFLQNDEFITELRSNHEFMSALQREHEGEAEDEDDYDYDESSQNYRGKRLTHRKSENVTPLDDATFRERIATMGKVSRKKFAQIAKVFSRGKRGGGPRSLLPSVGGATNANGKDLLMSSEPLIDEYDDSNSQHITEVTISPSPRSHP